ncbi:MAG: hypothetical protein ACLPL5_01530 [Stellaceae bacterium]|jgi:hypothetical protein
MAASRAVRQGVGLSEDQAKEPKKHHGPTASQRAWLKRGLDEPGGKLPMFDDQGRQVDQRTVQACIDAGWAEPWIANPIKPDWQICRLTEKGRGLAQGREARSHAHPSDEKKTSKT